MLASLSGLTLKFKELDPEYRPTKKKLLPHSLASRPQILPLQTHFFLSTFLPKIKLLAEALSPALAMQEQASLSGHHRKEFEEAGGRMENWDGSTAFIGWGWH